MRITYTIVSYCEESMAFLLFDPLSNTSDWVHAQEIADAYEGYDERTTKYEDFMGKKVETILIKSFQKAMKPVFVK